MPNIGTVLKEEINRLSRKECRHQVDPTRKAVTQHRRDIAALKQQVARLERLVAVLTRKGIGAAATAPSNAPARPMRFVAKGLRSQRNRLGLSAADFGKLLGVSAQSIYNWEREAAHPRGEQLTKLAALRGLGKREAARRLKLALAAGSAARRRS